MNDAPETEVFSWIPRKDADGKTVWTASPPIELRNGDTITLPSVWDAGPVDGRIIRKEAT